MFDIVDYFNKSVIGIDREIGTIDDKEEYNWCVNAIHEELKEWDDARIEGDFIKEIDSVMDLIYFATGFLSRMGIPPELSNQIFTHIHECNMNKKKGAKKRDVMHENDAIKPEGWVGPEEYIIHLLENYENRD